MICATLILWFRVYSRRAAAIAHAGTSLLSVWRTPFKTVGRPIEINACHINGQLKKKKKKREKERKENTLCYGLLEQNLKM